MCVCLYNLVSCFHCFHRNFTLTICKLFGRKMDMSNKKIGCNSNRYNRVSMKSKFNAVLLFLLEGQFGTIKKTFYHYFTTVFWLSLNWLLEIGRFIFRSAYAIFFPQNALPLCLKLNMPKNPRDKITLGQRKQQIPRIPVHFSETELEIGSTKNDNDCSVPSGTGTTIRGYPCSFRKINPFLYQLLKLL